MKRADERAPGRGGFSILELLIALVIMGLLASIAVPAYEDAQRVALNTVVTADLNAATRAIEAYITDQGSLPDEGQLMDAGFTLSPGVSFDKFDIKDANQPDERIHIHIAHEGSPHYFHTEYPTDPTPVLRWKKK